jgi:hypothetical protein
MQRHQPNWSLALLGAILVAAVAVPATEAEDLRRFALIAGANDGGANRIRLSYADDDARSFERVLAEMGGLAPNDTLVLEDPTPAALTTAFKTIEDMLRGADGARTELIFYYSGHSDDFGLLLAGEEYSYQELRARIQSVGADVRVAIVDSCSSGALTRSKGGGRRPAFLSDQTTALEGHAFLTSSSASEAAQESDRLGASFFTHHLVSGLRGAADTSGDGLVTLDEAYQHAFQATLASTELTQFGPQHPSYDINLNGSGQLVLTDLRQTNAHLVAGADVSGTVFVRDADGSLVAELHNAPGQVSTLGLAAGSYRVTVEQNGELRGGDVVVAAGSATAIESSSLRRLRRERTVARGDAVEPGLPSTYQPFQLGFLPNIALGPDFSLVPNSHLVHAVNLNVLIGTSAGIQGADLAGVSTTAYGDVRGFQGAGVLTVAHGSITGGQSGGVVAIAGGEVRGFQGAGTLALAGSTVTGGQAARRQSEGHNSPR